ncbi:amino acid adenylation domain-containing protein [Streptomyces sp. NBC_00523]|uniref:amino acid adenylation domain-containing protein n=1 Tax=Streptomyces sp. NBC_00523 TaxID=2975765 RepID=UPI002E801AC1|nr:amino acid adenylation domain-containing protein [Streptomyces sp. NBC_00523]WUD01288.1 amino acid adenylation domain-containing protein [Streptomyces sp. NBC_00523]
MNEQHARWIRNRMAIPKAPRDGALPLSSAQRQLWLVDQLRPGRTEYLVPTALRLRGPLDREAMEAALSDLVARHEVLRTRYVLSDGEPAQVVDEPSPVRLRLVECEESALRAEIDELTSRPVDLERDHPWRADLIRLAADDHVFLLAVHHIAFDGGSHEVLFGQLADSYAAYAEGSTPPHVELPVQYADFAQWQARRLGGATEGMARWKERLDGLGPLPLLTDHAHPAEWDDTGSSVEFDVPADLVAGVSKLGRGHGATPLMTVLTALHALLARITGHDDIAVGVPVNGRTRSELEGLVGCFATMLVIRADLSGDPDFATLLQQVRNTTVDCYADQDIPFEWLVRQLRPVRDPGRHPLFQVSLTIEGEDDGPQPFAGLTVEEVPVGWVAAKFDLTVTLRERADGGWTGDLTYPTAVFTRETVSRIAGFLVRLLRAVVADSAIPVGSLPLAEAEPDIAPLARSRPAAPEARVAELIAGVDDTRVAVRFEGQDHTYGQLNSRANRLAHFLLAQGIGRGDLVGVRLPRGYDLVVALLAVLRSGAAYLPLDPEQPEARTAFMVADAGARLVLEEIDDDLLQERADTPPAVPVRPHDSAYVIYTSGSTGRPKGVLVTHHNLSRLFTAAGQVVRLHQDDVWTLFHSCAFDFSVWELWGALVHGSTLVVVPAEICRSPHEFAQLLVAERVSVLSQTPSAFAGLVPMESSLRVIVFGGESLEPGLLRPWWRALGDRAPEMINMYGITETTVHVTARRMTPGDRPGRSPIGPALADLRLYVLDGARRPCPVGVPGEIYVGGEGVALGYLNRPELTPLRFLPDPFAEAEGARMYRSGDLARRLPDGDVEYLGRCDQQVKIRGHRVETGEIESALVAHPDVTGAVVTVAGDRLVAYAVTQAEPAVLRAHLKNVLPRYMMPSVVTPLARLPLTVNGKVDRSALPVPRMAQEAEFVAPRSTVEAAVASAYAEVLEVPRAGAHANFFGLGGDSIRAVRVVGLLRAAGIDVTVTDLYGNQTVAELAERAGGTITDEPLVAPFALLGPGERGLLPDGLVDAYPLSQTQAGMLYEFLNDDVRRYHNVTRYPVRDDGDFSEARLRTAASLAVARHEVLRTSLDVNTCAEPVQLVHPAADIDVRCTDLRSLSGADREKAVAGVLERERAEGFDLSAAPLLRLHAIRTGDRRWELCLVEFHLILDGWSHNSLVTELLRDYMTLQARGEPAETRVPAVRFADFVASERRSADPDGPDRQFWRDRLAEAEPAALPQTFRGEPDGTDYEVRVPLEPVERGLLELAGRAQAPLKSVLLAAHLRVLALVSGQTGFYAGLVSNGRPEVVGGDQVRGMFLNLIPVTCPPVTGSWREFVRAVFAEEIAVHPHRRYPMAALGADLGVGGSLLGIAFNYLNFHVLDDEIVDAEDIVDLSPNEFGLAVSTEPGSLVLTARPERVAPEYGRLLGRLFGQVLAAMASDPDGAVTDCLLPPADLRRALAAAQDTVVAPQERHLLAVIEDWVRRTPDAVAVEHNGVDVTYRALWDRTRRFARHLTASGVRPGAVVGISRCMDADLVAAILGVHMVGAAFLIVDPEQPSARTAPMLAHTDHVLSDGTELRDGPDAEVRLDLDAAAYLIYTSGSTGVPKAVIVGHRGVANMIGPHSEMLDIGPGARVAQLAPAVFDMALFEMFQALVHGATLCMFDPGDRVPGDPMRESLRRTRITHLVIVPSALATLQPAGLPDLRVVAVAGEECPEALADEWAGLVKMLNLYGPTEYTIMATGVPLLPGGGKPSIGRGITNTRCHVLDRRLQPVPVGVPGELCLAGPGVAHGYLGQPLATAAAFVPDPFGPAGSRMYRTGDRAVRRSDGEIEYLGRLDRQVKVRGHRVELGEIEAVLHRHPDVRQAVAAVHDQSLVAYVVGKDNDLTGFLRERLPDYMVPSHVVTLPELPRSVSGKLDRAALPRPLAGRAVGDAPSTAAEHRIARVWREALGLPDIGVDEEFHHLGGHSLTAVRIAGKLGVSVRDVRSHTTIRALATVLEGRRNSTGGVFPDQALVWFRKEGTKVPLLCVHPGGGSAHWYRNLTARLPDDQPVAAFQYPGSGGVTDLAARYLAEFHAVHPDSGARVLGWCGGAPIAWEMAAMLHRAGRDVELTLLDPIADGSDASAELIAFRRCEELLEAGDQRAAAALADLVEQELPSPEELDTASWLAHVRGWRSLLEAVFGYRYRAPDWPVNLVLGDESAEGDHTVVQGLTPDRYRGSWTELCGGRLNVHRMAGDHLGVLEPEHVGVLAAILDGPRR